MTANNYYKASAGSWTAPHPPPPDEIADVAVIGGGFTGLAAALRCAERGMQVVLYEAEHIGFGASGRNGGQLIPGLRWSASHIMRDLGPDIGSLLFDLCWRENRVAARAAEFNIECDLKSGHLEAAWHADHLNDMAREAEFLSQKFGYETTVVPRDQLDQHVRTPLYHGGIYDPHGRHFHPLKYAYGLARAAQNAGVIIIEGRRVQPEDVKARHIIVATDSWTGDVIPRLKRYTVPIANYNIATAVLDDPSAYLPSDAAVSDSRYVLNYYRLSADGRLIFGGGERYRSAPPADISQFVRPYLAKVFPTMADIPIEHSWGGSIGVTLNRLPHIGRKNNIYYAHGFSGHGALITTLVGEALADATMGMAERFDLFARLPQNPFPGGDLLRRPLAILGLFLYSLRDQLG